MELNGQIENREWFALDRGGHCRYLLIEDREEAERTARAANQRRLIGDERLYRVVRLKVEVVEEIAVTAAKVEGAA